MTCRSSCNVSVTRWKPLSDDPTGFLGCSSTFPTVIFVRSFVFETAKRNRYTCNQSIVNLSLLLLCWPRFVTVQKKRNGWECDAIRQFKGRQRKFVFILGLFLFCVSNAGKVGDSFILMSVPLFFFFYGPSAVPPIQAHLLSCTLDAIPCRMQCGQQVSRLAHDDHGRNFCPNRRQICDYCQVEFNGLQYDVSFSICFLPSCFLLVGQRMKLQSRRPGAIETTNPCRFFSPFLTIISSHFSYYYRIEYYIKSKSNGNLTKKKGQKEKHNTQKILRIPNSPPIFHEMCNETTTKM